MPARPPEMVRCLCKNCLRGGECDSSGQPIGRLIASKELVFHRMLENKQSQEDSTPPHPSRAAQSGSSKDLLDAGDCMFLLSATDDGRGPFQRPDPLWTRAQAVSHVPEASALSTDSLIEAFGGLQVDEISHRHQERACNPSSLSSPSKIGRAHV